MPDWNVSGKMLRKDRKLPAHVVDIVTAEDEPSAMAAFLSRYERTPYYYIGIQSIREIPHA